MRRILKKRIGSLSLLRAPVARLRKSAARFLKLLHHSPVNPRLKSKHEALNRPVMREMVRKAVEMEPLIVRPYGRRKLSWPPHAHDCAGLFRRAAKLRAAAGGERVETIVLLPHMRQLSGASRCGAMLADAIRGTRPQERTLVVLTDRTGEGRPPWMNEELDVLDFAAIAPKGVNANFRQRLLLDLVSGLRASRIVNVNSRLGWDIYMDFGLQLHSWADVYAYLFCWDLDKSGGRTGYPVRELQATFNHLTGVFFDSDFLREEIIRRYILPGVWRKRLHTLHTPADPRSPDLSGNFLRRRREKRPLRLLWTGRLDRQKRPDLAVEIMRRLPEAQLWMYGEPVLGGGDLPRRLPSNVVRKGVYKDFHDLPLEKFDIYLHTSEWDGLSNTAIHAGACGMPVVAGLAGGMKDLLDETTGWPVLDLLDPAAYVERIKEALSNPRETSRRAARLREKTMKMCDPEKYAKRLSDILEKEKHPVAP